MIKARLILDPPRDGFWNMAADEALFENIAASNIGATLRIYGWSRPTLSLGRRQKFSDTDVEECRNHSVDVVKRIGGGCAVLHGSDISYCFVSRIGLQGMPDMYDMPGITDPLLWRTIFVSFLESLGITGDGQESQPDYKLREAACFSGASSDEPTINGRKWVGSARRKSRDCFMQHGSILLKPQPDFLNTLMPDSGEDISIGLTELAPSLTAQSVVDAFVSAVAKKLCLDFSTGDYTEAEKLSIRNSNLLKLDEPQTSPYSTKAIRI